MTSKLTKEDWGLEGDACFEDWAFDGDAYFDTVPLKNFFSLFLLFTGKSLNKFSSSACSPGEKLVHLEADVDSLNSSWMAGNRPSVILDSSSESKTPGSQSYHTS